MASRIVRAILCSPSIPHRQIIFFLNLYLRGGREVCDVDLTWAQNYSNSMLTMLPVLHQTQTLNGTLVHRAISTLLIRNQVPAVHPDV